MKLLIIGTGKMAEAIIKGAMDYHDIEVAGRDATKIEVLVARYPKIKSAGTMERAFDIEGANIVFCVKPYALEPVSSHFRGEANALISVLAGTSLASLKEHIKAKSYVRTMPNLAASYQKSMTTLFGDEGFKDEAIEICQSFGNALWLNSEKEIDIATAVAGSGPAFLALAAEALMDGAVKEGLKREDATTLVRGLFEGFSSLLNKQHPAIIKDEVMSPGGTTAAGYAALEEGKVRDSMMKAIEKAYEKAIS